MIVAGIQQDPMKSYKPLEYRSRNIIRTLQTEILDLVLVAWARLKYLNNFENLILFVISETLRALIWVWDLTKLRS